jgi:hypothetical protein
MKKVLFVFSLVILSATWVPSYAVQTLAPSCADAPQYGYDPNGHYAKINDISLYYELYGD